MPEDALVVLSTFSTPEKAREIARILVEERLIACANLLPGAESIYRWKEAVEETRETVVLFKLVEDRYYAFEARLRELHPYEVPEIISLRVQAGHFPYLQWLDESCRPAWSG